LLHRRGDRSSHQPAHCAHAAIYSTRSDRKLSCNLSERRPWLPAHSPRQAGRRL